MRKIAHLSSVHTRNDTRIFLKQCRSLAAAGYETSLVVADGLANEQKEGVWIYGVPRASGRLKRILNTPKMVFDKAVALDADIYQLHDPELIPLGLKLKRLGKKVIFDAHEDFPKQMLGKTYLNPFVRKILSVGGALFERYACCRFDGIVAATPCIRNKFLVINSNTVDINNFPMISELDAAVPWEDKLQEVCYVGGIGALRGIREVVKAFDLLQTPARLNLAGRFYENAVEAEVKSYPGWRRVTALGAVTRVGVREVFGRSVAGLVTFLPIPNHIDAQPNKMFEYMSSGIPVIASNFPIWREIIEGNDCGLCVDPLDPKAIAAAIDFMINTPERPRQMGENGKRAVQKKYNWGAEEAKLLALYQSLLED